MDKEEAFSFEVSYKKFKSELDREPLKAIKTDLNDIILEKSKSSITFSSLSLPPKLQTSKALGDVLDYLTSDKLVMVRKNESLAKYHKSNLDLKNLEEFSFDEDQSLEQQQNAAISSKLNLQTIFGDASNKEEEFESVKLNQKQSLEWKIINQTIKVELDKTSRPLISDIFQYQDSQENESSGEKVSSRKGKRFSFEILGIEWQGSLKPKLSLEAFIVDSNNVILPRQTECFRVSLSKEPSRKAIFDLSYVTSETFLLIQIYKPYEGDISSWIDGYSRVKGNPDNSIPGFSESFAWYPIFLFDESQNEESENPLFLEEWTDWLYRFDENKYAMDDVISTSKFLRNKTNAKKMKGVPVKLKYRIEEVQSPFEGNFDKIEEFSLPAISNLNGIQNHIFVWPTSFNGNKAASNLRNFNVSIQLASNDDISDTTRFLKLIYDDNNGKVPSYSTGVHHHKRMPFFTEEIKVDMPLIMTDKHHILFSFYHVSFKNRKREELVGHSYLKILNNGLLCTNGEYKLPVCMNLVNEYLSEKEESKMQWLDSKKPCFTFKIRFSSSLYFQDPRLHDFYQKLNLASHGFENDFAMAVRDLNLLDMQSLTRFFGVIVNELISVVCSDKFSEVMSKKCFRGIISMLIAIHVDGIQKHPVVQEYVAKHFQKKSSWSKQYFDQLVSYWVMLMNENDPASKDILKHSWFFFETLNKSLLEHFLHTSKGASGGSDVTKKTVFKPDFLAQISNLLSLLATEVSKLVKSGLNIAKTVNDCISNFLIVSFSYFPADFVFKEIRKYLDSLKADSSNSLLVKLTFLKSVCSYEHAVLLSLPMKSLMIFDKSSSIGVNYSNFFFPHILQTSVSEIIFSPISNEETRFKAFVTLFLVLSKFESDPRHKDLEIKKLVFGMFLPTLILFSDNVPRLRDNEDKKVIFSAREKRIFSACVLCILRYIDKALLLRWMNVENSLRCNSFLNGLGDVQHILKYNGKNSILGELKEDLNSKVTSDSAKKYIENAYKVGDSKGTGSNLRELRGTLRQEGNKALTLKFGSKKFGSAFELTEDDSLKLIKLLSLQANEATILISSLISYLMDLLKTQEKKSAVNLRDFERLFEILKIVLLCPQHKTLLPSLMKFLGKSVMDFSKLFLKGSRLCADLSEVLLRQLGSPFVDSRWLAAEITYFLMRANLMETRNNIGKIKIQLTVAMSKIDARDPNNLKLGLYSVEYCSSMETNAPKAFVKMVGEFIHGLIDILRDKLRVELSRDDPEMQEDMYFRLAKGYSNAPDLRMAILDSLAEHHLQHNQFTEAAFCKLHCACMIAEYMKMKGVDLGSTKDFEKISSNMNEEKPKNEVNPDEEGICQSTAFSEGGMMDYFKSSIQYLTKAQLFEIAIKVNKLILPIFEKAHNYNKLATIHGDIKGLYENIISMTGKRVLATYFRVSFYGTKLAQLDGKQYIYKERSVTQLSEIVNRLSTLFSKKYGDLFELIHDNFKFNAANLNKEKVYLSIVYVEPYHETEDKGRLTYFDKMHNLTKFVFETPYTLNGKAQGDVENQCKRKTILGIEKPFPYIKKRLLVTSIKEIELQPLEVSIEAISDRCEKLETIIETKPLNLKNLQLLLQGIVQPQVNKGPIEIASTFLDKSKALKYPPAQVELLSQKFREMIELCMKAVKLSKVHSPQDQAEYNENLEVGFLNLKNKVELYLDSKSDRESSHLSFFKDDQSIIYEKDDAVSIK